MPHNIDNCKTYFLVWIEVIRECDMPVLRFGTA
jgi:hypothetical protein